MLRLGVVINIILILSIVTIVNSKSSKYSKDENSKNLEDEENPFRMKKTNLIWSKARLKLHSKKLAEAYAELELHDKREAELKKMRADGLDKAGVMEEKVLQSYKRLMALYALDNVNDKMRNEIDEVYDEGETTFDDPKLQSMWLRAKEAGFAGDDLKMLKQEFEHQQMKIDEHNFIHGEETKLRDSDNDIDDRKDDQLIKPDRKERKKDIHAGYMRLEGLTSSLPRTEIEFKDQRVNVMWELAKKTNWTQRELEDFKEELSHLDHKMHKQSHYEEKVKDSMKKFNHDPDLFPDNHKHVYDTSQLINKRVGKLHGELKTRLDKALRHVEL